MAFLSLALLALSFCDRTARCFRCDLTTPPSEEKPEPRLPVSLSEGPVCPEHATTDADRDKLSAGRRGRFDNEVPQADVVRLKVL